MATMVSSVDPKELLQAHAHAWNIMFSFMKSMSLKCAVDLSIAEAIQKHGKPVTLTELVSDLSLPVERKDFFRRIMRMLVELGIFTQSMGNVGDEEMYNLTDISQLLIKEKESKVSPFTVLMEDQTILNPWHDLSAWFKIDDDNTSNNLFTAGMATDAKFLSQLVIRDCGHVFEGLKSLVDVGGGDGTTALAIVDAFPHIKCSVLDLPAVVAPLKGNNKVDAVGGDMFKYIPPADAVLLQRVLHLWPDEECVQILQTCKRAVPKGGKVIVIDVQPQSGGGETKLLFDMYLVAHSTGIGMHRNQQQWTQIFNQAGFEQHKLTTVVGSMVIMEVGY